MQIVERVSSLRKRKIDRRDAFIAILLFLVVAMAFFGWFYLKAKKNPFDVIDFKPGANYRYLLSIYNPENLKRPLGVAVSPWGEVVVTDSVNHRIAIFDRNGTFKKTLGKPGSEPGSFNYPSAVAVSGKKIYVADFYNQRIQVLDFDGKVLSVIPASRDRKALGSNIMPITLTIDSQENLYVSDLSVQRILVFDKGGNFVRSFGKPGSNQGEISYVNGIAIDEKGTKIFLSNSNNARVDEYSMEGEFVKTLPASKGLVNPKGIVFSEENGFLYVADTFAHRITGIDGQGNSVETIGKRGLETGSFSFPTNVTVDEDGRLYVADRENNRVEVYTR